LRCRAHNQYTAEQTYGTEFMRHKREEARRRAEQSRARKTTAAEWSEDQDVAPWLRALGIRADDARRSNAICDEAIPGASLEDRIKFSLRRLAPKCARYDANGVKLPG